MYGPSDKDYVRAIVLLAIVGALLALGVEHGFGCLWHHLVVGWK